MKAVVYFDLALLQPGTAGAKRGVVSETMNGFGMRAMDPVAMLLAVNARRMGTLSCVYAFIRVYVYSAPQAVGGGCRSMVRMR